MSGRFVVASGETFQLVDPEAFRSAARAIVSYARRLSPAFAELSSFAPLQIIVDGAEITTVKDQHNAVCALLDCLKQISGRAPDGPDDYVLATKCSEYDRYVDKHAAQQGANFRAEWAAGAVRSNDNAVLARAIDEIVDHVRGFANPVLRYQGFAAYTDAKLDGMLPREIKSMHQDPSIALVVPMFEKSLSAPGDVAEFGCLRGTLSVKLAWMLKVAGAPKHYYAFDKFQAFEANDLAGPGFPDVGHLNARLVPDNAETYIMLTKWSHLLPLTPIKGDATMTCSVLTKPLSFVWLDLGRDSSMDSVLRQIWHLCHSNTIIGISDAGRPENPYGGSVARRVGLDRGAGTHCEQRRLRARFIRSIPDEEEG